MAVAFDPLTGDTFVGSWNSVNNLFHFSGTIAGNFDDLIFRNASTVSITGAVTDVGFFDARRGGAATAR